MYVARIPNRGSPPAILVRESYREGGKVKNRTLANLSHWPEHKVDTLARALKGLPPKLELADAFEITRSLPHGHVAAVLATAQRLGLAELIDPTQAQREPVIQPHAVRDDLRRISVTRVRHLAHDGPSGCVSTPRSSASDAPLTKLTVPGISRSRCP